MSDMSNKPLYSVAGLVIVAVLLLAVIALANNLLRGMRLDLTENELYTLSDGTRAILGKIDEPINLYLFYSQAIGQGIPSISNYAKRVREMLEEMSEEAGGKLKLSFVDPEPFSDEEDRAVELGIQSVPLSSGSESLYFGLAASNSIGESSVIPFLASDRESLLEYDLSKLVYQLNQTEKPLVGLLSTLDMGGGFDARRMQATPSWTVLEQLRQFFEIENLSADIESVPEKIDLLVLVHPTGLEETTLYGIDQFVLSGGKVLVFVDPLAESAQATEMSQSPSAAQSDLKPLFEAWGVRMREDEVLGDAQYALRVSFDPSKAPAHHYAMLGIRAQGMSQDDVITRGLERVNIAFAGILEPIDGAKTNFMPLISSSDKAMPIPSFRVRPGAPPADLQRGFHATGERYALAARLSGKVASAFPDGAPAVDEGEDEKNEEDAEKDQKAQSDEAGEVPREHLAESKEPINVVVFADTDLLTDRLWVQLQEFFGQRIASPFADNGDLVINAVDNLLGSSDLISIRTRAGYTRPFTRVEQLRLEAESRFLAKEQELQARMVETERKLGELQRQKAEDKGALILNAEQREAIKGFQQDLLDTRKELRNVRHELNKNIENLGTTLKFLNIVLLPLLLSIALIIFTVWRRRHARAALNMRGEA